MNVTLVQNNAGLDRAKNLAAIDALVGQSVGDGRPDLVVLPEYFAYYGGTAKGYVDAGEPLGPEGLTYRTVQAMARRHRVWIHAGSLLEHIPGEPRVHNTTVVFDRDGREVARYRKIHLFDIVAPDGHAHRESATVKPGDQIVTYDLEGLTVGCTICYDLRFSELFVALANAGADVIVVPAAFALMTGKDHWEVLLRARAIETQTYVLAAAQCGAYEAGSRPQYNYGHSLVCDPWGHVVARASDGVGTVATRLDRDVIARVRAQIPMRAHRRLGLSSSLSTAR